VVRDIYDISRLRANYYIVRRRCIDYIRYLTFKCIFLMSVKVEKDGLKMSIRDVI
jgi:hypothetical protein